MFRDFRDFLFRGNVVDLAVAVVIGAAFGSVVDGFIKSFIDPLLAILLGGAGQAIATVMIGPFPVGIFLSALVNFVLLAAVVYFLIVRPVTHFLLKPAAPAAPPPPAEDVLLLAEIRDLLKQR